MKVVKKPCKVLEEREEYLQSLKNQIDTLAKSKNEEKLLLRRTLVNYRKGVLEREQEIRFTQQQDRCLWLICQELTNFRKQNTKEGIQLDFSETSLQKLDTLLDTKKEMTLQVYVKEEKKVLGIIADMLPIRKYGDLRKFAKNRQLPNLYQFFYQENQKPEDVSFTPQELQNALDILEKERVTVLQKALDLEEAIHRKLETEFLAYRNIHSTNQHFDHNIYVEFLFNHFSKQTLLEIIGAETDAETIYKLRNRFIHNEIPYNNFLHNYIKTQNLSTPEAVIKAIIEKAIDIYQKLIEECQKA